MAVQLKAGLGDAPEYVSFALYRGLRLGRGAGMTSAWARPLAHLTGLAVPAALRGPGARPHLALVEEQEAGPGAWRELPVRGRAEPGSSLAVPRAGLDFVLQPVPQDYYFYLASNWQSAGNVHIDMASYEKIYDLKAENELPERIFLDKGTIYSFSVFLTARGHAFDLEDQSSLWAGPGGAWGRGFYRVRPEALNPYLCQAGASSQPGSQVGLAVVLADPACIEAVVKQKDLINRNSVLFWVRPGGEGVPTWGQNYWDSGPIGKPRLFERSLGPPARLGSLHFCPHPQVTLSDKRTCFDQGISGHHLMKTSMLIKVRSEPGGEDADEGKDCARGSASSPAPIHRWWALLGTASRTRTRGLACKYWTWCTGPCAGREGVGLSLSRAKPRTPPGNPMNAFLISFSFISGHWPAQPPTHSFHPFMFSKRAALYIIHKSLYVPSDTFL